MDDKHILPDVEYPITNMETKHYLKVDAYYGTTHTTAFYDANDNKVVVSNQNTDGLLGKGRDLVGKTIRVRTSAWGDLDDSGQERVRMVYSIDDQQNEILINEYSLPEDKDPAPLFKFFIHFK